MIEITYLEQKQLSLLRHLKIAGEKLFKLKIHDDLSPIGWHIIHCLYVECIWIRSQFLDDNQLVNKLKDTCLLYTSPSPRDSNLSRMPSSA